MIIYFMAIITILYYRRTKINLSINRAVYKYDKQVLVVGLIYHQVKTCHWEEINGWIGENIIGIIRNLFILANSFVNP